MRSSFLVPLGIVLPLVVTTSSCSIFKSKRSKSEPIAAAEEPTEPAPPPAEAPPLAQKKETKKKSRSKKYDDLWEIRSPGWRDKGKPGSYQAEGLWVGAKVLSGQMLGDFDGDTVVVDDVTMPTEFNFIPDIDASVGAGVEVSQRFREWEIAIGYEIMEFDGNFGAADMDTDVTYIDLMFRKYYNVDYALQPFVAGGIGIMEGEVEDGALDAMGVSEGELKNGNNYNVALGISLHTTPWVRFWGQLMWRFGRFDEVGARFGNSLVSRTIDADGWQATGGVSIRLLPARK